MPHVLIGSTEVKGNTLQGAVYEGESGGMSNLRYVRGDMTALGKPDDTGESFLIRIYNNSTGCLLNGGFKLNEGKF